ncbi:MAG: hypothetical protein R3215_15370 [Halomonas sp.]|nr:hypothetical protein [Halomonas sp.]
MIAPVRQRAPEESVEALLENPATKRSAAELDAAYADLEILSSREFDRPVVEGRGHSGPGAVVQFIARKR